MRIAVVYRSRAGTTRRYGEAIAQHLRGAGHEVTVSSVGDCDMAALAGVDALLLGCWTNGWFVIGQHPDEPWIAFARDLPSLGSARVGLFTTYQLATGSMFRKMAEHLVGRTSAPTLELRSRDGGLSSADRLALDRFLA